MSEMKLPKPSYLLDSLQQMPDGMCHRGRFMEPAPCHQADKCVMAWLTKQTPRG
jgi:hypothetical protein